MATSAILSRMWAYAMFCTLPSHCGRGAVPPGKIRLNATLAIPSRERSLSALATALGYSG